MSTEDRINAREAAVAEQPGRWEWYFAAGSDTEYCHQVIDNTRAGAIAQAVHDLGLQPGDQFTIVEATKPIGLPSPAGDEILGWILDQAADSDLWGEDGMPELNASQAAIAEAEAELGEFMAAWMGKHHALFPTPWRFEDTRNEETLTVPMAAA